MCEDVFDSVPFWHSTLEEHVRGAPEDWDALNLCPTTFHRREALRYSMALFYGASAVCLRRSSVQLLLERFGFPSHEMTVALPAKTLFVADHIIPRLLRMYSDNTQPLVVRGNEGKAYASWVDLGNVARDLRHIKHDLAVLQKMLAASGLA